MKKILTTVIASVASVVLAEVATVSDVEVRQLWPWSGDIDIGFTVEGGNTAVKLTAQYDGVEPFVIPEGQLSGDFFDAAPGRRHARWSLKRAGLDSQKLKNLKITASADDTDRTYLILNLHDGSYRYAAAEPEDKWTADPANYQTNIVFRRIPKGTKILGAHGYPEGLYKLFGFTESYAREHSVTLTSDFYLSVYPITKSQQEYAAARANGGYKDVSTGTRECGKITYDDLRGKEEESINWPVTRYDVAPSSMIAKYRSVVNSTFPREWIIDLPTGVQWEYAARATTPYGQIYSVGGDSTTTPAGITNLIDKIAVWANNSANFSTVYVGQRAKNGWGLYDMIGLCFEWAADWYGSETKAYSGVNPVGPVRTEANRTRLRRSFYTSPPTGRILKPYSTAYYGSKAPNGDDYGYRLCIHLKSLFGEN